LAPAGVWNANSTRMGMPWTRAPRESCSCVNCLPQTCTIICIVTGLHFRFNAPLNIQGKYNVQDLNFQVSLGEFPVQATCPTGCHVVTPKVAYRNGTLTFIVAGLLCLFVGPLAILAFLINDLKDVEHTCPIDGTVIGVHRKAWIWALYGCAMGSKLVLWTTLIYIILCCTCLSYAVVSRVSVSPCRVKPS